MPDNIATIAGKPAIMYAGKVPWHGLGTPLKNPATAAAAIRAASLDWEVVKAPLHLKQDTRYPVVADRFAMVRADQLSQPAPHILGIVGKDYTPLQNRDAFNWFDPIVGRDAAVYHTAGALGQGERVWILAKLPGDFCVVGDDITHKYLLLSNSHDGSGSVHVKFTPIRVVCQNTLTMALSQGKGIRIKHTSSLPERMALAEQTLGIIRERFDEIQTSFQNLATVALNDARLTAYLQLVFPDPADKEDERAMNRAAQARVHSRQLFEQGSGNTAEKVRGTLWAAYNGVTEFIDYSRGGRLPDRHLDSIWFGTGYLTKARAYRIAVSKADAWKN
jgi:phage/plasmid-like protein (TIGR03299 family)